MFCNKCGTQLPDGSAFCGNCGNPIAAPAAPVAPVAPVAEAPAQPVYEAPVAPVAPAQPVAPVYAQPVYQQPVAPAPKKNNTLLIVIVAIVAALAVAVGALWATGTFDEWFGNDTSDSNKDDKDDNDDGDDIGGGNIGGGNIGGGDIGGGDIGGGDIGGGDIDQPNGGTPVLPPNSGDNSAVDEIAFSLGTVDGGYYTNRFAGLKLPISSNWQDQGSGQSNIGLYMQSSAGDELVQILFVDCTDNGLNESSYLDQFSDALETQYAELGLSIRFDYPATLTVADHYGVGVTALITADNGERLYEGIFVYKVQNYLVVLNVTTLTEEGVGNIMNSFTAY